MSVFFKRIIRDCASFFQILPGIKQLNRPMKLLLLCTVCLLCLFSFQHKMIAGLDPGDPVEIIIIDEGGQNEDGQPHRSGSIPVAAAYYSSLSSLLLDSRYDLGIVTVRLENLTTNTFSHTEINATQGLLFLPMVEEDGLYEIIISLSDGHIYSGRFSVV